MEIQIQVNRITQNDRGFKEPSKSNPPAGSSITGCTGQHPDEF